MEGIEPTFTLFKVDLLLPTLTKVAEFPQAEAPVYPTAWEGNLLTIRIDHASDSDQDFDISYLDLGTGRITTSTPIP